MQSIGQRLINQFITLNLSFSECVVFQLQVFLYRKRSSVSILKSIFVKPLVLISWRLQLLLQYWSAGIFISTEILFPVPVSRPCTTC